MAIISYKTILHDRLWALAGASTEVTGRVRPGNRANLNTDRGWLKVFMSNKDMGDLPQVSIFCPRSTSDAYNTNPTLAEESGSFLTECGEFSVRITYTFIAKILSAKLKVGLQDELEEALRLSWLAGGPKLGNGGDFPPLAFVERWGPLAATSKETNLDTVGIRGFYRILTELTIPISIELNGAQLLTGVSQL